MKIEHIAIWTSQLEALKEFYSKYFDGKPGPKYRNEKKQFHSYFLTFNSGAKLEIMSSPKIPGNRNDTIEAEHLGIIHIAFEVDSVQEVDDKAFELRNVGYQILSGPRTTGDGYYEFATLDPDNNRLEVTTRKPATSQM